MPWRSTNIELGFSLICGIEVNRALLIVVLLMVLKMRRGRRGKRRRRMEGWMTDFMLGGQRMLGRFGLWGVILVRPLLLLLLLLSSPLY
jgi:hypothetical protein